MKFKPGDKVKIKPRQRLPSGNAERWEGQIKTILHIRYKNDYQYVYFTDTNTSCCYLDEIYLISSVKKLPNWM